MEHQDNYSRAQSPAVGSQEILHNLPYIANPSSASFGLPGSWGTPDGRFLRPNLNRLGRSDDTGCDSLPAPPPDSPVTESFWSPWSSGISSRPPAFGSSSYHLDSYLAFPGNEIPQDDAPSRKRPRYSGTTNSSELWLTNKFSKHPINDRFGGQLNIPPMDPVSIHSNPVCIPKLRPAINLPGESKSSEYEPSPVRERVTIKQRRFILRWYKGFLGQRGQQAYLSNDHVKALATLIDLQPQTVHKWICQNLMDPSGSTLTKEDFLFPGPDQAPLESSSQTPNGPDISKPNGNSHLSREIIQLIESYVETCKNKRARNNGRRQVNVGKYECTFSCGYRTKRAFDWKRHEENHQPQNLWLCTVCSQEKITNFLVHRADKLLKHVQDKHADSNPEDVIKSSELAYKASFQPQCGFCGYAFNSWEDRIKHIRYHFDGEGSETQNMSRWREPWYYEDSKGSASDQDSDDSDELSSSDDSNKVSGGPETARRAVLRQEPAGRKIFELPADRPTKRGLEKLLNDDDCSKPRKRQLHQTSLGPKIGEQAEAVSYNNTDQDDTHSSSSPLSPSTKLTDITMSSAPRSVEDISNEGTSEVDDSVEDPDGRFLNPTGYFNKLRSLRSIVFQNSAIQHYSSSVIIPTTNDESAISSNRASLPMARINERNIWLRISFHPNEWFETDTSDNFWLGACSRTSSKEIFDLLECRNLMVRVYSSLKLLQKAGFCGSFFSVLVLDKYRPAVARLVPIQITSVEVLVQLFHTTLTAIGHVALSSSNLDISDKQDSSFIAGNLHSTRYDRTLSQALTKSCLDLLALVQLEPAETVAPQYIWRSTAHFLDLAVLSYVGAHTENIGEIYLQMPVSSFTVSEHSIPTGDQRDEDCGSEKYIYMKQRKLQCLDQFLRQKDAWVFHAGAAITSGQRLCLSTDADTLADIWGPMWKTKSDPIAREVSRYNIGNGFIVPWSRNSSTDPEPRSHAVGQMEVFCHWIPSRNWDETLVSQHQSNLLSKQFLETDILLVGADVQNRLVVNDDCHMSLDRKLKIKEAWKNKRNLRHIGTRKPRREKDSQSYQVQASAMGFVTVGSTVSYKRSDGFDMKDALIERWRNGTRKIQELEVWGGVEVSLCTQNARRRTLRHLLGCPGMHNYLRGISFKWHDDDCERQYFESLENCQTFRKFWKNHPQWHDNVGDAINECFGALEETGVDETNDELAVLWVEVLEELDKDESDEVTPSVDASFNFTPAEEHLVILRRSEHSWTGFLKDSPESLTMAMIGDKCLDFRAVEDYGMRCQDIRLGRNGTVAKRYSLGYSALHTSLLINEELVKSMNVQYRYPDRKRKRRTCGATGSNVGLEGENCRGKPQQHECLLESPKGHWDMMNIKKCSNFSLGTRGYLTLYKLPVVSCDPLLVEWEPVLNTFGKELKTDFNERVLGKSGDKYHSEYNGGIWKFSPVPCLLISKTVNQR